MAKLKPQPIPVEAIGSKIFVFRERRVMLGRDLAANVLRSKVAVRASIQVVRAFVNLRQMLAAGSRGQRG
jgi:hypothetical protein